MRFLMQKLIQRVAHYLFSKGLYFSGTAYQPEFSEPIVNLTIPIGRDATFRCLVHHLGGYRVRP